jgi:hypothetical protein
LALGRDVDSAWVQYKLEARIMLENGDDSHLPVLGDLPRVQCTILVIVPDAVFGGEPLG